MSRVRILSLDGGGVKGAYSAAVLASIEKQSKIPIHECFDLITGSSTGGILAIGLALGISAADLCKLYEEKAKDIFPYSGALAGWLGVKHDSEKLKRVLDQYFGNRSFGEAKTRLVVTAYNASSDNPHVFKTFHHPDLDRHYKLSAAQIALATAAAPTYFEAMTLPLGETGEKDQVFLDGGVWANAPTLVGITEAVRYMDATLAYINMLSIGTGYKPFTISKKLMSGGKLTWVTGGLIEFLLGAQQASAVGTAKTLLSDDRFVRIQKVLEEDIKMDDAKQVGQMIEFGKEDGKKECEKILQIFCDCPVEPFKSLEPKKHDN